MTKPNQDIVVPCGRLQDLFAFAARLQKRSRFPVACFGHAGDGNIHVNIMVDFNQPGAEKRSRVALDQLFAQVLAWRGSTTGAHGKGLAKKPSWSYALPTKDRLLHRTIKPTL